MARNRHRWGFAEAMTIGLALGIGLAGCKEKPKPQPPVKLLEIRARAVTEDHRRFLKIDYQVVDINNRCKGGSCAAEMSTRLVVKNPDGDRMDYARSYLERYFARHGKEPVTKQTYSHVLPLPVQASGGQYQVRIQAEDKVGQRMVVKKVKVQVPPEHIATLKIKGIQTKLTVSLEERFVEVNVTATGVHNRCPLLGKGKREFFYCTQSVSGLLTVITPQGTPLAAGAFGPRAKMTFEGPGWQGSGTVSFMVSLGSKEFAGKWTFKVELTDDLTKKRASTQTTLMVEDPKKAKK